MSVICKETFYYKKKEAFYSKKWKTSYNQEPIKQMSTILREVIIQS